MTPYSIQSLIITEHLYYLIDLCYKILRQRIFKMFSLAFGVTLSGNGYMRCFQSITKESWVQGKKYQVLFGKSGQHLGCCYNEKKCEACGKII